ncbi:MAG: exonuclease SbcCD subunit D [Methanomicrobiales archaeon]|nr:exonuclease SbcCD subunit D [Methanomicrobiales archaeon]
MRIIHIADTHLGFAAFNVLDADGMNLREKLIYEYFLQAIDQIIQSKPDVLVHAGDLFDQVRPKTRSYITVLEALERLKNAGIPVVAIAGNHSMSKTRYTVSPFSVLEYYGAELHAAYRYRYVRAELGGAVFHLIPNMLRAEDYRRAFDQIEISGESRNILVTHGLASTLRDRRLRTVAEHEIDSTMLSDQFDYIALGHFHAQQQVADNAWYSGSLEYFSYGELHDQKGALQIDLDRRTVSCISLPHTPMMDAGTIDCQIKTPREIMLDMKEVLSAQVYPEKAMVQLTLENISREKSRGIDYRTILAGTGESLLHLHLRKKLLEDESPLPDQQGLDEIDYVKEFRGFVTRKGFSPRETAFVASTGEQILQEVALMQGEQTDAP